MLNTIKFELKRAFINKYFLATIIIGLIITVSHVILNVIPAMKTLDNYLLGKGEYPVSVFNKWIGGEGHSFQPMLYILLLPILSSIPYADSLFLDRKTGYTKNLFIRVEKRKYYISKIIAAYLSAGIAVIIPLLVNLFLTALCMPSLIPEPSSMTFPIVERSMWSGIFYTHPYVYILLYLIIIFLYSGLIAVLGLVSAFFAKNRFSVLLTPFVCYIFFDFILKFLRLSKFSPEVFLRPNQPAAADFRIIVLEYVIILFALVFTYFYKGNQDEVY